MDPVQETPQVSAKVLIDPDHPEAGRGGVVPPEHSRFGPGNRANPGGRPKGALPRSAWLREIAAKPDDDGIGEGAARIGRRYAALQAELETATAPRADLIRAEMAEIRHSFSEAEGRPQERVEHSGEIKRVSINLEARPAEVEKP